MVKPILTAEDLRLLFSYSPETGQFTRLIGVRGQNRQAGTIAGSNDKHGYIKMTVKRQYFKAHRLAWLYTHGVWPKNHIDHINGNRSDNRLSNLRDVPRVINSQNHRKNNKNNKSHLLGVISPWGIDKKFRASIGINGESIRLGRFDTAIEAHQAYLLAKRQLHTGCTI